MVQAFCAAYKSGGGTRLDWYKTRMPQALETPHSAPGTDWLLTQYALGRLPRAASLLARTYLEMNPAARPTVERVEQVGGWSLEHAPVAALSDGVSAASVLDRIEDTEKVPGPAMPAAADTPAGEASPRLPDSLMTAVGRPVTNLPWKWRGVGAYEYRLREFEDDGIIARLLRIEPGRSVPRHTHSGLEATLVLTGAYVDSAGRFAAGDIELADDAVDHRPVAEQGETCLCLAVNEAPMKLTGRVGRFFQPFF